MAPALKYLAGIASTLAAGLFGSYFIRADSLSWYDGLLKPPLTPPPLLFGIVWLSLYVLIGLALGALWTQTELWHPWLGSFYIALAFNAAWTMFFFGFHTIFIALVDLLFLFIFTISLVLGAWEIEKRAAYLLLPYLVWLAFALYLNAGIWLLS